MPFQAVTENFSVFAFGAYEFAFELLDMSSPSENERGSVDSPSVLDEALVVLIDAEKIVKEPPTLKVASDSMRSLLASIAMFSGCIFLYFGETFQPFSKWMAIGIGLWVLFYSFLAVCQVWAVMLSGTIHLVQRFMGKDRFKKHIDFWTYLIVLPSTAYLIGLGVIIWESVRHVIKQY